MKSKLIKLLNNQFVFRQVDNMTEIQTPFINRFSDSVNFYIKDQGDCLKVTDEGFTHTDYYQEDLVNYVRKIQQYDLEYDPQTHEIYKEIKEEDLPETLLAMLNLLIII